MSKLVKAYLGIGIVIAAFGAARTKKEKPEIWDKYSTDAKVEAIAAIVISWPYFVFMGWREGNESES